MYVLNQNLSIFQGKHRWSGNFEGPLEVGWMLRICDEILRGKKLKNLRANISTLPEIHKNPDFGIPIFRKFESRKCQN